MSTTTSPYAAVAALLASSNIAISPAEIHGLLLGRSSAGAGFAPEPWLADLAEQLGSLPEGPLQQALLGLQAMARSELEGDELALTLLLPDDTEPLAGRIQALVQWCQGFLSGFGLAAGSRTLGADVMESLEDLAGIARIGAPAEESAEAEHDYMEITEYLRVVPVLLFTECVRPPPDLPPGTALH